MSLVFQYENLTVLPLSGSVQCSLSMGGRGTCSFSILGDAEDGGSPATLLVPTLGAFVSVFDFDTSAHCIFRGRIQRISKTRYAGLARYDCSASTQEYRLQSRFIDYVSYSGVTAGAALRDIISVFAQGDVQQDPLDPWAYIEDGASAANMGRVVYAGVSVADALDDLAQRSNYVWYLDAEFGYLHFVPRALVTAGVISVDASNLLYNSPQVISQRTDHFNRVSLTLGWEALEPEEITFAGDSVSTSFDFEEGSPVAPITVDHISSVKLNDVAQQVGVLGVDTGKDWYYTPGESTIYQASGSPIPDVLIPSDSLVVLYYRTGANVITVQDSEDIAAVAALENGSGIMHAWIDDASCTDYAAGVNRATQLLAAHCPHMTGSPPPAAGTMDESYMFEVSSLSIGAYSLQPGMIVPLEIIGEPSTGGSVPVMVSEVSIMSVPALDGDTLRYSVTASRYLPVGSYLQFFEALAETSASGLRATISESSSVTVDGTRVQY